MKMKVFEGKWYEAMDAFNAWAKGKLLNREVIIQTHMYDVVLSSPDSYLLIVVIHPEDPFWDATPEQTEKIKSYTTEEIEEEKALKVTA